MYLLLDPSKDDSTKNYYQYFTHVDDADNVPLFPS